MNRAIELGSRAELYVFDFAIYDQQVVPFFRQLILHGNVDKAAGEGMDRILPLVNRIKAFLKEQKADLQATDLDAHCNYLGHDFRLLPSLEIHDALEPEASSAKWELRTCGRKDCPAQAACPFHGEDQNGQAKVLSGLFGAVVKETCLSESQFVGRSMNVFHYKEILLKNSVSMEGELWKLMLALGTRGFVVGHTFAESDGIHGWLTGEETARLAILLKKLPLPDLAPQFAAMERISNKPAHSNGGWEFDELSLCFVKTVAMISTLENKGILWGNDVLNWLEPAAPCEV